METKPGNVFENFPPELGRALLAQAAVAGVTPEEYFKRLLSHANGQPQSSVAAILAAAAQSSDERMRVFNAWASSQDPSIPALSVEDVSRESIYD
jgi:hypothetical protein